MVLKKRQAREKTLLKERFKGSAVRKLLATLFRRQMLCEGNSRVCNFFSRQCKVVTLPANAVFIRQGGSDTSIFFILTGRVRVLVNGREVATRVPGQHVGEMALIDPASKRTATVVTIEPTELAQVSERSFTKIADANPFLWRNIAIELGRRLNERSKFHHKPNSQPILFVGSSKEGLPFASALATKIPKKIASVSLWSEGVFGASRFPIEDLSAKLHSSDFAVLFASADDVVIARGKKYYAPRDNIVFELGLFMGALTRQRTFLIVPKGIDLKIPSDLLGINTLFFDSKAVTPTEAVAKAAEDLLKLINKSGTK